MTQRQLAKLQQLLVIAATAIHREPKRNQVWVVGQAIHAKALEDALKLVSSLRK